MPEIDNFPFLSACANIVATADLVVEKLERDVTPETEVKVAAVVTTLNTQSKLIRLLAEHQVELTDKLSALANKIENFTE